MCQCDYPTHRHRLVAAGLHGTGVVIASSIIVMIGASCWLAGVDRDPIEVAIGIGLGLTGLLSLILACITFCLLARIPVSDPIIDLNLRHQRAMSIAAICGLLCIILMGVCFWSISRTREQLEANPLYTEVQRTFIIA